MNLDYSLWSFCGLFLVFVSFWFNFYFYFFISPTLFLMTLHSRRLWEGKLWIWCGWAGLGWGYKQTIDFLRDFEFSFLFFFGGEGGGGDGVMG